eukprot:g30412.t1
MPGGATVEALPPVATSADQTFWSAANDSSFHGRMGIKSLVNVNNTAELLHLAYLQSRTIGRRMAHAFNKSTCIPFQEGGKPEFVLFTGDIPSHQLSCQFHQARTIEMVITMLAKGIKSDYFPNYNISLEPNSPWQQFVASVYAREGVLEGEALKTFARGGYYTATPRPGLRLLVLNTVVWSQKVLDWDAAPKRHVQHHRTIANEHLYKGADAPLPGADTSGWTWDEDVVDKKVFVSCDDRPADPYGQLAWARAQLAEASRAGERVIVAGHVPPGDKVGSNNFCPQHLAEPESDCRGDLVNLTRDFAEIIEVQLYGDHSNDEFRMVWSETGHRSGRNYMRKAKMKPFHGSFGASNTPSMSNTVLVLTLMSLNIYGFGCRFSAKGALLEASEMEPPDIPAAEAIDAVNLAATADAAPADAAPVDGALVAALVASGGVNLMLVMLLLRRSSDSSRPGSKPGGALLSKVSSIGGQEKDPLPWQIDTGFGFLKDAPDDQMGDLMGGGMALAKGLMSKKKGGLLSAMTGGGGPSQADLKGYELQNQLKLTMDFARRAVSCWPVRNGRSELGAGLGSVGP